VPITYLKGDATSPQAKGAKVIVHCCNDAGGWGRGFVLALSKRWEQPEAQYRLWYRHKSLESNPTKGKISMPSGPFGLGEVQLVQVLPDTYVINLVGQAGTKTGSKGPPIRYKAMEKGLGRVSFYAEMLNASVHMPRIGCSLAGGRWSLMEPIINKALAGQEVFVYDITGGEYNP
jgi:O-acetyl-ADP-ribose deacetylase (regulator of RNase III)